MATIMLYANKANQMPGLVQDVKKSILDYKKELFSLRNKLLNIDQSTCNMDDVVSSIQAATRVQEEKIASLEALQQNSERFVEDAARIDGEVADIIRQRKDDFYEQYSYLKPECEKNNWEKICDGCKKFGEWCREHWKAIVTAVVVVIAVVALVAITVVTAGAALGPILTIVVGVCKGIITGAIIGGLMGGLSSVANGGSFLEGLENGAFSGALMGAFFGGLGGLGRVLGSSCKIIGFLRPVAKALPVISKIFTRVALGMFGFDLLSLGISLFSPNDLLVQLNRKLHSSKAYNAFQFTVTALAAFSGGFVEGMRRATCFVAGTMVLTAAGLIAIERIKAGDKVTSTDPETKETAEGTVLETYVRETKRLVHLIVNGEEIITTVDHPFYVDEVGFVNAGELRKGARLLDAKGSFLIVESTCQELVEEPVTVYNFQVEEFHTYYVGENCVLVHNAQYGMADPYELEPTHSQTRSNRQMNKLVEIIRKDGGIKEPIKYVKYNGVKYVVDGHHRLIAAKRLGLSQVPIEEVQLPYGGYNIIEDLLHFTEY